MPNHPHFGSPWQRFGGRVTIVGLTWAVLAGIALLVGPQVALLAALIPLGLAAAAAWRAKQNGEWTTPHHQLRRQVTALAMLMAVGIFSGTFLALRDKLPPWAIFMELGLLLHYWLLTLG